MTVLSASPRLERIDDFISTAEAKGLSQVRRRSNLTDDTAALRQRTPPSSLSSTFHCSLHLGH